MRRLALALALVAAAGLLFLGVGYQNATATPLLVRHTATLEGLARPLTVVVLSDTHYGNPDMPGARLDALVDQVNALRPDLILLAGDYMGGKILDHGGKPGMEPAVHPFKRLRAPLGAFAVIGNHDNLRWSPIVFGRMASPRLLQNAHVDVGPLTVAGATSAAFGSNIPKALAGIPPGTPVLLILHEGDRLGMEQRPADLPVIAFAGHTHGGQVVLPLIGSLGGLAIGRTSCNRGPCTINGWPLIVTSGVGTSWLPIRFGVPPEVLIVRLQPPA